MSVILTDKIQPRTTGIALTVVGDTNVSGALTCTNFTASGDVSIGGTLTYEDVTNIDSVGLITARTGVRVTAGGVVVTAGVSTFTDDVKVNSTLTATEGLNVTAGVSTFAGNLSIADKIIHTGDTDTTIRFPAVDTVSVETAAVERVRVDSSGRVGVGTAPAEEVHILAATPTLLVEGTNTGSGGIVADVDVRAQYYRKAGYSISDSDANEEIFIGRPYGSGDTTAPLVFNFQGTERVRFRQDGKVGVGTDNPGTVMHLLASSDTYLTMQAGSASGNGGILFKDSGGTQNSVILYDFDNDYLKITTNDDTERLRITSSGNVDINGTPPWTVSGGDYRNLSISGQTASSSGFIWLGNGAAASNADFDVARIRLCNGGTEVAQIAASTYTSATDDGRLTFSTKSTSASITERIRIQGNGQILYSAAGGDNTITSKRTNAAGSNGNYFFQLNANNTDNNTVGSLGFHRDTAVDDSRLVVSTRATGGSNTERLRINSDGQAIFKGETTAAQGSVAIEAQDPAIRLYDTNGTADVRKWEMRNVGAGSYLQLRMINDANNTFTDRLQITSTGRFQYYSSAGSFTSFRESFKSGAVSNSGTFTAQTHNCHACGTVTITSNLDGSSNNKKCMQFPISLNSTSNANLGSAIFEIDGSSGQNFSVAGASKGVTVTNSSGNTVYITVTFDITGSV